MAKFFLIVFTTLFGSITMLSAQLRNAKIAVGAAHSIVLNEKGEVFTFGAGVYGELGQGGENRMDIAQAITHPLLAGKTILQVSLGTDHMLVLTNNGEIYGWGGNGESQLGQNFGNGDFDNPKLINEAALDTATIVQVIAGNYFSMFLSEKGTLFVLGQNDNGFMGIGTTGRITTPTPIHNSLLIGEKITKVSSSISHKIVLTESNKVFAFGSNSNGQLGDGSTNSTFVPVESTSSFMGKTIVEIATAEGSSAAVASDGTLFTWGNFRSPLGLGRIFADVRTPTIVTAGITGKSISKVSVPTSKLEGLLVVATDGTVFMAGESSPIFGLTAQDSILVQIPASQFDNKPIVDASISFGLSLFIATDGSLFGAGENAGTGYNATTNRALPLNTDYLQGKTIEKIVTGNNNGALIATDGTLFWFLSQKNYPFSVKSISSYRLRNIRMVKDTPTLLNHSNLSGHTITNVKAGALTTYLLTAEGKVFSFGNGKYGTLGNGDSLEVYIPTLIDHANLNGKKIVDIAVSSNQNSSSISKSHALLLADDGSLYSMGSNEAGQLGLGDSTNRYVPSLVSTNLSGKTVVKIAVAGQNSMAITSDGSVYLWGSGGNGEMGFGNTTNLMVPTLASHANINGKKIIDGALGQNGSGTSVVVHILLLTEDHQLYSFGENTDGQLGQGNKTNNYIPSPVIDTMLTNETIVSVKAGQLSSMLLTKSGKLFGWGNARRVGFVASSFTDCVVPTLLISNDLNGRKIIDFAMHAHHGLTLYDDGTVLSFGNYTSADNGGALGNGPTSGDGTLTAHYSGSKLTTKLANFTLYQSPIPTTNLVMHLNAERGLIQSNDSISVWGDLSSIGTHTATATGLQRPIVVDSAINNRKVLRFNGTNSYFTLPTAANLNIQNSDYEVFIVAKSGSSGVQFLLAGETIAQHELHLNGDAGVRFIPVADPAKYVDVGASGVFTNGEPQLYNVQATSTFGQVAVNRNPSTLVNGNMQSPNSGVVYLGRRTDNSLYFNGDIAEVIIYNGTLSAQDRNSVEVHLFNKYGIQNYKNESASLTGTEGWRLLSSPVADSSYASFFRGMWTQGFTGAAVSHGSPNVYTWPINSGSRDSTQWTPLSNASTTFTPGQGILAYIYSDDDGPGNANNAGFPKTLTTDGFSPSTDVNLNAFINPNTNGWSLLGNPFSTNIDWDLMTKTNLSGSIYVWDNTTSEWKSWNGSVGGLDNGLIGPFNGFFVETLLSSPELSVPISAKIEGNSVFLGKELAKLNNMVEVQIQNESGKTNKAWIEFSENGLEGKDAFDAVKLVPLSFEYVQISTADSDGKLLDSNQLPLEFNEIEIPVYVNSTFSGIHEMSISGFNLPEDWNVELLDTKTGESINREGKLSFTPNTVSKKQVIKVDKQPEITTQTASESRFVLKIGRGTVTSIESQIPQQFELSQNYPNPFNPSTTIQFGLPEAQQVRLDVFDITGRLVKTMVNEVRTAGYHTVQLNASNLSSGMYFYRLRTASMVVTKKMMLIK